MHILPPLTTVLVPSMYYLGNPNQSSDDGDPDDNDDAIYAELSWKEDDIERTIILLLIILGVVVPILFAILRTYSRCWLLPCGDCRRFVDMDDSPSSSIEGNTKHNVGINGGEETEAGEDDTDTKIHHDQYGIDEENPYLQEPDHFVVEEGAHG